MATVDQSERVAWLNRFVKPSAEILLSSYSAEQHASARAFAAGLRSRTGRDATVEWRGIPWRWTLAFRRPGEDEPWAYLIPAAEFPLFAMPIAQDASTTDAAASLPKSLREPLDRSPLVGQIRWVEWPVTSEACATDLLAFIDQVCDPHSD